MMRFVDWNGNVGVANSDFGALTTAFTIVILVDLVLLGVWLWKQVTKK